MEHVGRCVVELDVPRIECIFYGVWCDCGVVGCYHCRVDAVSFFLCLCAFPCLGSSGDVGLIGFGFGLILDHVCMRSGAFRCVDAFVVAFFVWFAWSVSGFRWN